jgi:hypothetical protein
MGLLDDLKRQATEVSSKNQSADATLAQNIKLVEARMQQCYLYLIDLAKQLNVLKPELGKPFPVAAGLQLEGLQASDFFVDGRKKMLLEREHFDYVVVSFQYSNPNVFVVRKDFHQVKPFTDLLMTNSIAYEVEEFKNDRAMLTHADFKIRSVVKAGLRLQAFHEKGLISFKFKNVERIGLFEQVYAAEVISEPLLEDLAKCLLGMPNNFRRPTGVTAA